jgi:nucleotide-binding universal stress UspA family protein
MPPPTAPSEDVESSTEMRTDDPPAREVVVGVDGTESALGAVRWAAQEAARRDAPLRIVHAAPYLGRRATTGTTSPEVTAARKITAQAYTVARHSQPGVRTSTQVVPADPTPTLLRAAADAQLVVLGSSTTGAADEWVLASVAVHVAALSPQPVVVVPRQRSSSPVPRPVAAVLGVGEPEDDERVVSFAADAAERAGTPLVVLQTRPARGPAAAAWLQDPQEWERRFPELEVRRTDLPGASANQVLGATCPSPLVVLSAGHGSLLHRGLDGPHRWLLRHCTSPMALVPPAHRAGLEPREETVAVG